MCACPPSAVQSVGRSAEQAAGGGRDVTCPTFATSSATCTTTNLTLVGARTLSTKWVLEAAAGEARYRLRMQASVAVAVSVCGQACWRGAGSGAPHVGCCG